MTHILKINASVNLDSSVSRAATAQIVGSLGTSVTHRDLVAHPLPQIDNAWAEARLTDPKTRTPEDAERLALSDQLIAELQAADVIVIGAPLYNFAAPASLKAWMDLVARPGVTFRYSKNGAEGLLTGKKAIVAVATGGVAVGSESDHLSPHLRLFLGFIGITDVEIVVAKDIVNPIAAA